MSSASDSGAARAKVAAARLEVVRAPYAQPPEASIHAGSGEVGGQAVPVSPFLVVEEVAERYRMSRAAVHELTRAKEIPHRVLPGTRRCLFLVAELEAWEQGSRVEVVELERGGRVVRPT